MKLQSKNQKKKIILISVLAVVLVACLVGLVIALLSQSEYVEGSVTYGIKIAANPSKMEYYLGEEFDPSGLRIQVLTTKQEESYFVDYTELEFSGFDSSEIQDELTITVSYEEFSTTFTVKIKDKPSETPVLVEIRLSDNFTTTYKKAKWEAQGPQFHGVNIVCIYSDGTQKEVPIDPYSNVTGVDFSANVGTTEFKVTYSEGGQTFTTTVQVTITE